MIKELKKNLTSAINTIMPLVIIVLILSLFVPIDINLIISFLLSSILLIVGLSLFTFGADLSLAYIGNKIGKDLVKSKKIPLILIVGLLVGTFVTIAEPDLMVLAEQITSISSVTLILLISLGVGICTLIAAARAIWGWDLNVILIISFAIIFLLVFFVPIEFIPFAFDSGGVTTGTISIPFLLTLGMGLVANRMDKKAKEDSFGLIALGSTGPIIMVLILGLFYAPTDTIVFDSSLYHSFAFSNYFIQVVKCFKEVILAISPILVVFIIYNIITNNVKKMEMRKILFGIVITIIGLTLFLVAANVGFLNMGYALGNFFASTNYKYFLVFIIMILSFFIAIAEPAVIILIDQVKEYTGGGISDKALKIALALGVSIASGMSMLRVFTQTPFFYLVITGYGIAFLLTFVIPKVFTAIAFDAGGATGGSLTTAFLLPMSIGACVAIGGNVYKDAFGLASMVSLIPIITIEIVGLLYQIGMNYNERFESYDDSIIEYDWEVSYE